MEGLREESASGTDDLSTADGPAEEAAAAICELRIFRPGAWSPSSRRSGKGKAMPQMFSEPRNWILTSCASSPARFSPTLTTLIVAVCPTIGLWRVISEPGLKSRVVAIFPPRRSITMVLALSVKSTPFASFPLSVMGIAIGSVGIARPALFSVSPCHCFVESAMRVCLLSRAYPCSNLLNHCDLTLADVSVLEILRLRN